MMTTDLDRTDRIIKQGKTLLQAIEAIGTIRPNGWFEKLTA
jgi:hypothetical protein